MTEDERFMARAIELARRPVRTRGNPRVGAVVVRAGDVIGEGWHQGSGTDHAEAVALRDIDAAGATIYVNLEPCNHHGRRPPCAPLLVEADVARVVIGQVDPDDRVAGQGIAHLRDAGIEVTVGVLEAEAEKLNAPFLHHRRTGRPFVTLKLAMSADGRMGAPDGTSRWITGSAARAWVHARRAEVDAVMVGSGTVIADDPSLTSRADRVEGQPLRVIIDGAGRVPRDAKVFDDAANTLMLTTAGTHDAQVSWKEAGAEVVVVGERDGHVDLGEVVEVLGRRGLTEVLCEGGGGLATALLAHGLVDRLTVFYAPVLLGAGGPGIGSLGNENIDDAERFRTVAVERYDDDVLVTLERAS